MHVFTLCSEKCRFLYILISCTSRWSRTTDLLLVRETLLNQLSYARIFLFFISQFANCEILGGAIGIRTLRVFLAKEVQSPFCHHPKAMNFYQAVLTANLRKAGSFFIHETPSCALMGSNHRPTDYESVALTT